MQQELTAATSVARVTHSKKHGTGAKCRRTTFIYYDEEHEKSVPSAGENPDCY